MTDGGPFTARKARRSSPFLDDIEYVDAGGREGLFLFKDVPEIMRALFAQREASKVWANHPVRTTQHCLGRSFIGYASRTTSPPSARALLKAILLNAGASKGDQLNYLGLADSYVLLARDKQYHMQRICEELDCDPTGILFFDNEYRNIESTKQLGVVAEYCRDGLTWNVLEQGLRHFALSQTKRIPTQSHHISIQDTINYLPMYIATLKSIVRQDEYGRNKGQLVFSLPLEGVS